MNTLNLETITNKNFEIIISNLIGTDCRMEFSNYTKKHEKIALNLGLTIYVDETLTVLCETDEANNYY
jgi:predicted metalloprotease with PDZ domain